MPNRMERWPAEACLSVWPDVCESVVIPEPGEWGLIMLLIVLAALVRRSRK